MKTNKTQIPVIISLLPLLAMLAAILPYTFMNEKGTDIVKIGVLALLLTGVAVFYIKNYGEELLKRRYAKTVITLSYLVSLVLLVLVPNPEIFCFWMFGGLIVAMLIDYKLGLLLHFSLSFLMGLTITMELEHMIMVLIVGSLMCLLSGSLKQSSTVIYSMIIILSTNITVAFIISNFIFDNVAGHNYLMSLFSSFLVLISGYLINRLYEKNSRQFIPDIKQEQETELAVAAAQLQEPPFMETDSQEENTVYLQQSHGVRTSYEVLCDDNNELLQKIKNHSEALYTHSLHIGELSYRAAIEVGANALLAKAGGYYHEVGKIRGKNYIEEGLVLAEEYDFPNELKAILRGHNIKYEKPSTVEAAIVMLSDNIVATMEYIEKNEVQKLLPNKIIENIFQMRMEKGSLDSSFLTLKDFKKLKEFYLKEFIQQS